jgi:hypothetical protein
VRVSSGAAVLVLAATLEASAATAPPVPDFSGVYLRVGNLWFDPILDEPAQPVQRLDVDHPNADDIWAGDSNNPILQPWAREIVKRNADSEIALKHVYTADDTCRPSGVPQALNLIGPLQILQLKDHVVMIHERDQQVRRVWLNVGHAPNLKPSWYGESVGHYEGDTLVVDTIGVTDRTFVDYYRTPHTEQIHVVERFKMVDGGKTLHVDVNVEDPGAFTMAWNAIQEWVRRDVGPHVENLCEPANEFFYGYDVAPLPKDESPDF